MLNIMATRLMRCEFSVSAMDDGIDPDNVRAALREFRDIGILPEVGDGLPIQFVNRETNLISYAYLHVVDMVPNPFTETVDYVVGYRK